MDSVIGEIAAERQRQVAEEGWSHTHDDKHWRGELSMAAALYAAPHSLYEITARNGEVRWQDPWPWFHREYQGREQADDPPTLKRLDWDGRKKHPRRRRLVIAAALIIAEIERLDRLPPTPTAALGWHDATGEWHSGPTNPREAAPEDKS